jgi:hypothetical protein
MDESDEQFQNAASSIHESLEGDSNVTSRRDAHSANDWPPNFSTDEGMQIDDSDEHPQNAPTSI